MTRPLDGTLVLDLTRRYPGAYTAMLLADFGADVIKVDPPGQSIMVSFANSNEEEYSAYFAPDRNKRSLVLDLKHPLGKEAFLRLAQRADVLLEGFRPGVMDRLGLGHSHLRERNPRLIYCALTGFGQDGPYADLPGHDMNFIALGGALSLIGERNGQPYLPSNLVADFGGAAMHGALGITFALLARHLTGRGQFVDVAYLDTVISLLPFTASDYFRTGIVPKRGETGLTGGAVYAQVFRCKDGEYVSIGAAEPQFWANLCRALAREDLIPEQFAEGQRADQIVAELAAIFTTRTRDEWTTFLNDKQTCSSPVYYLNETFADPQVLHRRMVAEVPHSKLGTVRQIGVPVKLSDTPGEIRHPGVPTGTHTEAILAEFGYPRSQIALLREQRVIG